MHVVYAYAAGAEGDAVAERVPEALRLGVGKAAAAAAMAERLCRDPRPDLVCLFGVCGAYPEAEGSPPVGGLCLVGDDQLADEGLQSEDGFADLNQMNLGSVGPFAMAEEQTRQVAEWLEGVPILRGATVSTCSGTEARSRDLQQRTGAHVETMEGAAVALVCRQHDVPLVQLRCVSNRTGNRAGAGMDLPTATSRLQRAVLTLVERGWR